MHVVLLPGEGHERHNHPDSDEILYILAGRGEQMVDDSDTFGVGPGQAVFIPKGAFHSTVNTGWEPLVLLAIYAPAGAEEALKGLPDHREVGAGRGAAARARLSRAPRGVVAGLHSADLRLTRSRARTSSWSIRCGRRSRPRRSRTANSSAP